jgi:cell division protein FtsX
MRALKYFLNEAIDSLWRGWRAALLAILTIAAGLFVLGFFLMINANLQRGSAAGAKPPSCRCFHDEVTSEQLEAVDELVATSGLAGERHYISKADAIGAVPRGLSDLRVRPIA